MTHFAYLFERFPSFGQTFCYREVADLDRRDITPPIFSIRNPKDEPSQDWDMCIVKRVNYLPVEKELLDDVRRASKKGKVTSEIITALDEWGRRTDFLRLYQEVYVGLRLQQFGVRTQKSEPTNSYTPTHSSNIARNRYNQKSLAKASAKAQRARKSLH